MIPTSGILFTKEKNTSFAHEIVIELIIYNTEFNFDIQLSDINH
jgi:hypothetical protein